MAQPRQASQPRMMSPKEQADFVANGLWSYYSKYIMPIEQAYHFDKFMTPCLGKADFTACPMVLLMGQYSVGKTTFVRYLLGRDFPGMRIGPEPTTDKFSAIMYNANTERVVPGNAAAVHKDKPFRALASFGMSFLNRFEVSEVNSPLLEHITLIDSPGILSGEKQRIQRGYDFSQVISYWATRSDRVLLLFDAHKLDISDEFKEAILALRSNFDKIRCVLNKADQVSQQQLMRVYGALLWSLGKVVQTPEVMRVYISSFWDQDYRIKEASKLFDLEKEDLLTDLKGLPRGSAIRKINEFVKRTRRAKVHALICDTLRSKFGIFGKEKKQKQLLSEMPAIFQSVATKHSVPLGDFPNPHKFAAIIKNWDMWKFPTLKPEQITAVNEVLSRGMPKLLEKIEFRPGQKSAMVFASEQKGGAGAPPQSQPFQSQQPSSSSSYPQESQNKVEWNPFAAPPPSEPVQMGGPAWVVTQQKKQAFDAQFYKLELVDGRASGAQLRQVMMQSGLDTATLGTIWGMVDFNKRGSMSPDEFALMCHLISMVKEGKTLPDKLTIEYIPPALRKEWQAKQQQKGGGSVQRAQTMAPSSSGGGSVGMKPPPTMSQVNSSPNVMSGAASSEAIPTYMDYGDGAY